MEFRLTYQGELKANGKPKDKQKIRREFHRQFLRLWSIPPLDHYIKNKSPYFRIPPKEGKPSFARKTGDFIFAPLINTQFHLVGEIDIILLRPETPGSIIARGGDIDNRLKTLLDALRMPQDITELPKDDAPQENEDPFFCLLEDDNLITKISVTTDMLLDPTHSNSYVELILHVKTKALVQTWSNVGFS